MGLAFLFSPEIYLIPTYTGASATVKNSCLNTKHVFHLQRTRSCGTGPSLQGGGSWLVQSPALLRRSPAATAQGSPHLPCNWRPDSWLAHLWTTVRTEPRDTASRGEGGCRSSLHSHPDL